MNRDGWGRVRLIPHNRLRIIMPARDVAFGIQEDDRMLARFFDELTHSVLRRCCTIELLRRESVKIFAFRHGHLARLKKPTR